MLAITQQLALHLVWSVQLPPINRWKARRAVYHVILLRKLLMSEQLQNHTAKVLFLYVTTFAYKVLYTLPLNKENTQKRKR